MLLKNLIQLRDSEYTPGPIDSYHISAPNVIVPRAFPVPFDCRPACAASGVQYQHVACELVLQSKLLDLGGASDVCGGRVRDLRVRSVETFDAVRHENGGNDGEQGKRGERGGEKEGVVRCR